MRAISVIGLVLGMAPVAVFADPTDDQIATFRAAVEEGGCMLETEDQTAAVEVALGEDKDMFGDILGSLLELGEMEPTPAGTGFKLTSEICQ